MASKVEDVVQTTKEFLIIIGFLIALLCANLFVVFLAMFILGIEGPIEYFSLIGMGATLAGFTLGIPALK